MTLAVRASAVLAGQLIELADGRALDAPQVPLLVDAVSRLGGLVAVFAHDPAGGWTGLIVLDATDDGAVRS